MSEITELTIKLIKLGVRSKSGGKVTLWHIEYALTWLQERGYSGYIAWGTELSRVKISKHDEIVVSPGHELEGLLEHMLRIVKEEK